MKIHGLFSLWMDGDGFFGSELVSLHYTTDGAVEAAEGKYTLVEPFRDMDEERRRDLRDDIYCGDIEMCGFVSELEVLGVPQP